MQRSGARMWRKGEKSGARMWRQEGEPKSEEREDSLQSMIIVQCGPKRREKDIKFREWTVERGEIRLRRPAP